MDIARGLVFLHANKVRGLLQRHAASSVLHTTEAWPINTTLNMQKALLIPTFKSQVVHSDLKAKNILLTKDQHEAKISDVGLARYREA